MKRALVVVTVLVFVAPVLAQRPSDPALLVPESAPELDYVVAPTPVTLPAGMTMGAAASVAFDANGHLFVLTRGAKAFFEFDRDGTFIRAFGDKLFTRSHGLRIDREGNLWATDVGGARRRQDEPRRADAADDRHQGRGGRVERSHRLTQAESAQRRRDCRQRRHLRRAGAHAGADR